MNKPQIDYAVRRIDAVAGQKMQAYRNAQPKHPALTSNQKIDLIRKGKAKLKADVYCRTDLCEAFDYPDPNAAKRVAQERAYAKYCGKVKAHAEKLKDRVVLLDGEDATALIDEFITAEIK